ncbi:hypothetical protein AND_002071 [Anopheles darlingi]|uniref:Uncharacterized protein n=1 Tax=Anopheles darlingi TaxID=43151 RepID=W5JS64_ANODA|nr:hypothetical protein AND_002071 [Anopheles darlingi]
MKAHRQSTAAARSRQDRGDDEQTTHPCDRAHAITIRALSSSIPNRQHALRSQQLAQCAPSRSFCKQRRAAEEHPGSDRRGLVDSNSSSSSSMMGRRTRGGVPVIELRSKKLFPTTNMHAWLYVLAVLAISQGVTRVAGTNEEDDVLRRSPAIATVFGSGPRSVGSSSSSSAISNQQPERRTDNDDTGQRESTAVPAAAAAAAAAVGVAASADSGQRRSETSADGQSATRHNTNNEQCGRE